MAAKHCLGKYRQRLKASRVSQTRVVRSIMARQQIVDSADRMVVRPRQTGKATITKAITEYLSYYSAGVSAPSGKKVVARKPLRQPSHNVNKNGRSYYLFLTRVGEK